MDYLETTPPTVVIWGPERCLGENRGDEWESGGAQLVEEGQGVGVGEGRGWGGR